MYQKDLENRKQEDTDLQPPVPVCFERDNKPGKQGYDTRDQN